MRKRATLTLLTAFLVTLVVGCPPPTTVQVTVFPENVTLDVGQITTLTASSTDAQDTDFEWTADPAGIVDIRSTKGAEVEIEALVVGQVTLTATGNTSNVSGTAVVIVPETPGGEGEGEGEDPVTPPALLAPGVNFQVLSVTIPADRRPVVSFTLKNNLSQDISIGELSQLRMILGRLTPAETGDSKKYESYTVVSSGDTAGYATYDPARYPGSTTGLTQLADNSFRYRFSTVLPLGYDVTATHQLSGQIARTYAVDGKSYVINPVYTFRPDGGSVSEQRRIVDTATCNNCHTRLGIHGGNRREIQYCIMCHNDQRTGEKESIDMVQIGHKIHMGADLPSVQGGDPYEFVGNDFSDVVFPRDIRDCTSCHNASDPESLNYLNKPGIVACGSCHDRTWFGDPNATPQGWEDHPLNFTQTDDHMCVDCHPATGNSGPSPVLEAHLKPTQRPEALGLKLDITAIAVNQGTGQLTVTFTAKNGDNSPITSLPAPLNNPLANPAANGSVGVVWASSADEYATYKNTTMAGSSSVTGTLDSTNAATGVYVWTSAAGWFPTTEASYAIGLTGRRYFRYGVVRYPSPDPEYYDSGQGTSSNGMKYFTFASAPTKNGGFVVTMIDNPRRPVVDEAKCNKCHGEIRAHGDQRYGVAMCLLCHSPNSSDISKREAPDKANPLGPWPPETINLKDMLHSVHRGEKLENPYTVYGYNNTPYDFTEVLFPGILNKCDICHTTKPASPGSNTMVSTTVLPLDEDALPTTIRDGEGTIVSQAMPTRASCNSCHDGLVADVHMLLATNGDGVETCEICHEPGATADVATVHAMLP